MKNSSMLDRKRRGTFFALASPALFLIAITFLAPFVYSMFISLTKGDTSLMGELEIVGLSNYLSVIKSPKFHTALGQTLLFVVCTIMLELTIGFIISLLLNIGGKGSTVFRVIFSIPLIIAPIVSGLQWRWLFADQYGLINYLLSLAGIKGPFWLADPSFARIAVLITNLWLATPFVILVLTAGLANLSPELNEAAKIDGASRWQIFWQVTLPQMKPTILIILVIRLADAFRVYDVVYILTGGGPGGSTEVLSTYIYKRIFTNLEFGQGAAASFIVTAILVIVSQLCNRLLEEKEG